MPSSLPTAATSRIFPSNRGAVRSTFAPFRDGESTLNEQLRLGRWILGRDRQDLVWRFAGRMVMKRQHLAVGGPRIDVRRAGEIGQLRHVGQREYTGATRTDVRYGLPQTGAPHVWVSTLCVFVRRD